MGKNKKGKTVNAHQCHSSKNKHKDSLFTPDSAYEHIPGEVPSPILRTAPLFFRHCDSKLTIHWHRGAQCHQVDDGNN